MGLAVSTRPQRVVHSLRFTRSLTLAAVAAAALTLAGCGSQSEPVFNSPTLPRVDADGLIGGRTPTELRTEYLVDCMHDAGWVDLEASPSGSVRLNPPEGQEEVFDKDYQTCVDAAYEAFPLQEFTDEMIAHRYRLELETAQCLSEQGYAITTAPSEAAWIQQFREPTNGLWLPYAEAFASGTVTQEEETRLKSLCPDPADRYY